MEEAYAELYKQFIELRNLCLKQAALLHRLTAGKDRNRAPASAHPPDPLPFASIPVQCTDQARLLAQPPFPYPNAAPPPLAPPAAQAVWHMQASQSTVDDLGHLVDGVDRLQVRVGGQRQTAPSHVMNAAEDLTRVLAPPCGSERLLPPGPSPQQYSATAGSSQNKEGTTNHKMPWLSSSFLDSDLLSRGGFLLSEATLHSQVCEFCQAVFPSDTTTRGEFLRHLTAHVT
ncbi:TRAF family member-associated NF-kappa-B activator [Amia ocellicauda]|uniref:TRAF family member-associated NF-kappa-B activator n=1 Tax=Amia ocellicauda TaxID=2972642 RepID=UPI003463E793